MKDLLFGNLHKLMAEIEDALARGERDILERPHIKKPRKLKIDLVLSHDCDDEGRIYGVKAEGDVQLIVPRVKIPVIGSLIDGRIQLPEEAAPQTFEEARQTDVADFVKEQEKRAKSEV